MKTIFRYELPVAYDHKFRLPADHRLLSVAPGRSGYHIDIWMEVPPGLDQAFVNRVFYTVGTGHLVPDGDVDYIGTAVMDDNLVWHVYAESVSTPS